MKNQIHHVILFVKDIDRSIKLHRDYLGFEVEWRVGPVGGQQMAAIIGIPGIETEIAYLKSPFGAALELMQLTKPEFDKACKIDFGMPGSVGVTIEVENVENLWHRFNETDWQPLTSCQQIYSPAGELIKVFCFRTEEGVVVELIEFQTKVDENSGNVRNV